MFIYILLIMLVILFLLINNSKNNKTTNLLINTVIFVLLFLQVFRSLSVGTDLSNYSNAFYKWGSQSLSVAFSTSKSEILYIILNKITYFFGLDFRWIILITSLSIHLPLALVIKKHSKMPIMSLFIYITFGLFLFSFSGLRQTIAIGLILFGFKYAKEKKFLKYLILVIIATLFHSSAFITILIYPLLNYKINKKILYAIPILFLSTFVYAEQIITFFIRLFDYNYSVVVNPAYNFLIMLVFFWAFSLIKFYKSNNQYLYGLSNIILFAIFIQIFSSFSPIAMRMGYYFQIFLILLIPEIFNKVELRNERFIYQSVFVLFFTIIFITSIKDSVLGIYPYEFYFTNTKLLVNIIF